MLSTALLCLSLVVPCSMQAPAKQTSQSRGVELASLDLELQRLESWGERRYRFLLLPRSGGAESAPIDMGTMTLFTEFSQSEVVVRDTFDLVLGDRRLFGTSTLHCRRDSTLTPTRMECDGDNDEMKTFVATMEGELATIRFGGQGPRSGQTSTLELPRGTITFEALFRIVTLLPRKTGTRIVVPHFLETGELNLKRDFVITSLGPDTIRAIPGDVSAPVTPLAIPCTRYSVDASHGRMMFLWVGESGVLERTLLDETKLADRIR